MIKRHFRVWKKTALMSIQGHLATKGAIVMYIAGKFIRFFFFLWLLLMVMEKRPALGPYSRQEIIFFYLFFTLFDMFGQIFFRGVYYFDDEVRSGQLDLRLVKPVSLLFQLMTKITDLLDLPLMVVVLVLIFRLNLQISLQNILLGVVMGLVAMGILIFVHAVIAALGIITAKSGSLVRIFRDFSSLARVPVDLYQVSIQAFLFTVVPVGVAMTFPAKVFLGKIEAWEILLSLTIFSLFFGISRFIWRFSLTRYSSAGG